MTRLVLLPTVIALVLCAALTVLAQRVGAAWVRDVIAVIGTRDGSLEGVMVLADVDLGIVMVQDVTGQQPTPTPSLTSPDGMLVAEVKQDDGRYVLVVTDVERLNAQELMRSGWLASPVWSPDGSRIAFTSTAKGSVDIFSVEVETGEVRQLTTHYQRDELPMWSPDGRRIAFISLRDQNWDVFVVNADGSRVRNLTNTPGIHETRPIWRPR